MPVSYDPYNPIRTVGTSQGNMAPITFTESGVTKLARAPSGYIWKLEDVSAADSGRTEDTTMYKEMVGQVVGLELSWTNIGTAEASAILQAFNPEYFYVCYLDLKAGTWVTKEFYCGNRSAPAYNTRLNVWQNVSFNIIARRG